MAEGLHFLESSEEKIFKGSINRINDIANSLLTTTQKQTMQLPMFQPISTLIQEIVSEKKNEFVSKNIDITFDSKTEAKAFYEPIELKRILSNLINNSVEATKAEIKIHLITNIQDKDLILDIIDNGSGIPQKILSRLGNEEVSTKSKGNGLGIKEASDSMNEWNGKLEILESSSAGTTIRLTFKAKDEAKQYYLIDDDALVRMTWESRARKNGIALQTFSSHNTFIENKNSILKDSIIYIDSELGNVKGEDVAYSLNLEGFLNISMTSGHPPEKFKDFTFLRSVISKAPPF
jgi:hypothetical protein